jgi:Ni,Fe-hydrogenase III large subunit
MTGTRASGTSAAGIIRSVGAETCRPWPRHTLPLSDWEALIPALHVDTLRLLALWADTVQVHALFLDEVELAVLPVSVNVEAGIYPALSPARPVAQWFERLVHDLWGHRASGGTDLRPWIDHGFWPQSAPLALRPGPPPAGHEPPEFRFGDMPARMQIPIGPVGPGIGEAAHLRLSLSGREVAASEARLGYTHKGTLALMRGKSPRTAARFAARLAGDSTVAHSIAFAEATEAALHVGAPPRAASLRAVMAEVERVAGHLDQLAAIAETAGARDVHARCGLRREWLLRASEVAFGHRLIMDCVVPGGVAVDIDAGGREALLRAMGGVATELPELRRRCQDTAVAARLAGIGIASPADIARLAVGGVVGRASGRGFDARCFSPIYEAVGHVAAIRTGGDAEARNRLRLTEIAESLRLIGALLETLPEGPLTCALPTTSGEGIGCAEAIHGDVWHWLRLDHGQIAAVFPRDPGWTLWPLAEHMLPRTPVEEVGLVRCSLGLPVSGMDL